MILRHDTFLPLFTNKLTHESLNTVHSRLLNGQYTAHFLWKLNTHERKREQILAATKVCAVAA
jgi:hypothetical protein